MRLRRGQRVDLWYRYPLDLVPRPVTARILHDGCSYGIQSVVDSPTPTMDLLGLLEQFPDPDVLYTLSYASIRPPPFFPETSSRSMVLRDTLHNNPAQENVTKAIAYLKSQVNSIQKCRWERVSLLFFDSLYSTLFLCRLLNCCSGRKKSV